MLKEQEESLNATKNELDGDTLQQWVSDVQQWSEGELAYR